MEIHVQAFCTLECKACCVLCRAKQVYVVYGSRDRETAAAESSEVSLFQIFVDGNQKQAQKLATP